MVGKRKRFVKNTPVFAKYSLSLYNLYHAETQSKYPAIQPELEIDISTKAPTPAGQKPTEFWHVSGLRCTALHYSTV